MNEMQVLMSMLTLLGFVSGRSVDLCILNSEFFSIPVWKWWIQEFFYGKWLLNGHILKKIDKKRKLILESSAFAFSEFAFVYASSVLSGCFSSDCGYCYSYLF